VSAPVATKVSAPVRAPARSGKSAAARREFGHSPWQARPENSAPTQFRHSFEHVRVLPREAGLGEGTGPVPPNVSDGPATLETGQGNAPQPTAGTDPTGVTFSTGKQIIHTPPCGHQTVKAIVAPAGLSVTWALSAGTAALDAGTTIDKDGNITLSQAQVGGSLKATATSASGASAWAELTLSSHPTGIASTSVAGDPPNPKDNYGATFDHVFNSNDQKVESLENVAVGEKFPNVPNPDAADHDVTGIPFGNGTFKFRSSTLTSDASNNWFLTKKGGLNGTLDRVTMERSGVDIGQHIVSASNPKPANPLPAKFSLQQDLHWYCPAAAADKRWTNFVSLQHERKLTDTPEFVVTVNKVERKDAYTGPTGVQKATATPASIVRSEPKQKAGTVQISATALPSGRTLHYSIRSTDKLGCSIDAKTGLLTIGTKAGEIVVRVANAAGGPNYDEVKVTITDPPSATPKPPVKSGASTGEGTTETPEAETPTP
jgi:hypothetical protein